MAWGRKKSGARKEPQFGLGASLAALRLSPEDRIPSAQDKARKSAPKRRQEEDEDEEPPRRERKAAMPAKRSKRRGNPRRISATRLIYWGVVLGLWAGIAVVGAVIWAGAHLPPIQSLEIPKRPPTIEIVGLDGSVLAQRGEMAGALSVATFMSAVCAAPINVVFQSSRCRGRIVNIRTGHR